MIKVLEDAIEKIKKLPEDRQAMAAEIPEQIASDDAGLFAIPAEDREAILDSLGQAQRGEFASDEQVDTLLGKPWR